MKEVYNIRCTYIIYKMPQSGSGKHLSLLSFPLWWSVIWTDGQMDGWTTGLKWRELNVLNECYEMTIKSHNPILLSHCVNFHIRKWLHKWIVVVVVVVLLLWCSPGDGMQLLPRFLYMFFMVRCCAPQLLFLPYVPLFSSRFPLKRWRALVTTHFLYKHGPAVMFPKWKLQPVIYLLTALVLIFPVVLSFPFFIPYDTLWYKLGFFVMINQSGPFSDMVLTSELHKKFKP